MSLSRRVLSTTLTIALAGSGVAALTDTASAAQHGRRAAVSAHGAKDAKHPVRPAAFVGTGTLLAVDLTARTVTIAVRGGSRDLHRSTVVAVVAATAVLRRNDVVVGLDGLQAGDHLAARGLRGAGGVLTVLRLNASGPVIVPTPAPAAPAPAEPAPAAPAPAEPAPAPVG